MKKLVALFLTAAMMLCALPAFATEINWADLEAQSAETVAKGEFVTFDEISIKMWMPTVLSAVELTDEDQEGGYIGYYMTEDESAAISVVYADVDGMSLEDYKAALADNGRHRGGGRDREWSACCDLRSGRKRHRLHRLYDRSRICSGGCRLSEVRRRLCRHPLLRDGFHSVR